MVEGLFGMFQGSLGFCLEIWDMTDNDPEGGGGCHAANLINLNHQTFQVPKMEVSGTLCLAVLGPGDSLT